MKNLSLKTTTNLPYTQMEFINLFDGTLKSISKFENLGSILNPTFTAHFFVDSVKSNGDVVTTKSTTGEFAYWGSQTNEQMANAYLLASELKSLIIESGAVQLQSLLNYDDEKLRGFASKISQVRKRAAIVVNGELLTFKGLNIN